MIVPTAEVTLKSDGIETRYRRQGSGPSVLLLAPGDRAELPFRRLAEEFRVVQPLSRSDEASQGATASGTGPGGDCWIRGIIDGLGLGRCALVALDSSCLAGLGFALSDPDRVSALAMVLPDPWESGCVAEVEVELFDRDVPIMVVRRASDGSSRASEGDGLESVLRFLRERAGGASGDPTGTL